MQHLPFSFFLPQICGSRPEPLVTMWGRPGSGEAEVGTLAFSCHSAGFCVFPEHHSLKTQPVQYREGKWVGNEYLKIKNCTGDRFLKHSLNKFGILWADRARSFSFQLYTSHSSWSFVHQARRLPSSRCEGECGVLYPAPPCTPPCPDAMSSSPTCFNLTGCFP